MKYAALATAVLVPIVAHAKAPPKCDHWPEMIAMAALKNAGLLDPAKVDQQAIKATLLAAQPMANGRYKEIYDIVYVSKTGETVAEVITSNVASDEECSVSDVSTFVVSRHLP
ncbi:hypothetical protein NFI95_03665 [Acetobacteraceae bacterium KSS8]|uniref:DUF4258 domain-containing protein n=1 Tax=Endosaccharibacter trunci TaxID=2812733 RepID=A0ABT1W6U5_9PROT|nr:hypothetical protein [Acetobacteraceae bacterium KSS8]